MNNRRKLIEFKNSLDHVHPFLLQKSQNEATQLKVLEVGALLEEINLQELSQDQVNAYNQLCQQVGIFYLVVDKNLEESLKFLSKHSLYFVWDNARKIDTQLAEFIFQENGFEILTNHNYILRAQVEVAIASKQKEALEILDANLDEYIDRCKLFNNYAPQVAVLDASAHYTSGMIASAQENYDLAKALFDYTKNVLKGFVINMPELHFFLQNCYLQLLEVGKAQKDAVFLAVIQQEINDHNQDLVELVSSISGEDGLIAKLRGFSEFDWNKPATYVDYSANYHPLEKILDEIYIIDNDESNSYMLSEDAEEIYGKRCLELGMFYVHIKLNPDLAQKHLERATEYLKTELEMAMIEVHKALCNYQIYTKSKNKDKKEFRTKIYFDGMSECDNAIMLIGDSNDADENKTLALVYYVRACFLLRDKKYDDALVNSTAALKILDVEKEMNMQYLQTKFRHGKILMKIPDKLLEGLTLFNELESLWRDLKDRYATECINFFVDFGHLLYEQYATSPDRSYLLQALEKFRFADTLITARDSERKTPGKTKIEIDTMIARILTKLEQRPKLHKPKPQLTVVTSEQGNQLRIKRTQP